MARRAFERPGARFGLWVPDGWASRADRPGTIVTVSQPLSSPGFAANVNVLRYDDARQLELEGLVDEAVEAMRVLLTDFVLLEREGASLTFTFRQGIYGLTSEQRYVLDGDAYFVVTGTATNADYAELGHLLRAVLTSFTVQETWTARSS